MLLCKVRSCEVCNGEMYTRHLFIFLPDCYHNHYDTYACYLHFFLHRLKKEMVLRLNQVAAEFRKVSNKQMAETTKRTIRENVSINAQLAKMSDKTMELIQENDELRTKEKKMKMQVDMLEHNEKELAKKNSSNQKVLTNSRLSCTEFV